MYIITDVASLESIPEGMKASKIMILCGDGESFAAQDVSKMLALSAQMTPVPKGSSFAFAFGKIAGGLNGKPEDTIILSADPEVTKAAEAFGYSTVIAKQKRVTRTRKKKKSEIIPPPVSDPEIKNEPGTEKTNESNPGFIAFIEILKDAGVTDVDPEKIREAVRCSQEYISYELQLRMKLLDKEKAAAVYAKTKDKFAELKKAADCQLPATKVVGL